MSIRQVGSNALWKLFPSKMEERRDFNELKAAHALRLAELQKNVNLTQEEWAERNRKRYLAGTGHELDLDAPRRFTEKIQWRMLYGAEPLYSVLADKYAVREWVKDKIGDDYLIPLLGVWDRAEDIDFRKLPDSFVLKTNNAYNTNIIVPDKKTLDVKTARENLDFWLKKPFWAEGGEMQYRAIKPRIIAEQYMIAEGMDDLPDYKFFCFDGNPYLCQLIVGRWTEEHIDLYDMDWSHQEFAWMLNPSDPHPKATNAPVVSPKPANYEEMKRIAEILSAEFDFVRVDLYEINGKVYFGEMTFTPGCGLCGFRPDAWDYTLGELWHLDTSRKILF